MTRFALLFLLAASTLSAHGADLVLADAWVRYVSPGVPAAGYFTLRNLTDHTTYLVGGKSAAYGEVMLHKSSMASGMAKMEPVTKVEVPAHGEIKFSPGAYHLMLMSPRREVAPGDRVPITLQFAGGQTLTAEFAVRGPGSK